jgi:O-antigen/teichoic acid export membrane protein
VSLFSPKAIYWIKTLSKFVSVQLVVQALGLASGILLVRTLDQTQYAYYTIANTMQATMSLLADMGIGVGLSAIGGKVWHDRYRFGQLINTALQLRYYLAGISVTIVTPILLWMLIKNGASIVYAILITVVVLVGLNFQLTTVVLGVVPRLHSQISRIQDLDLLSAASRLAVLGATYLIFLDTVVAITTASLVTGLQRFILGYWVADNIDTEASINREDRAFILSTVKKLAPNGIFFCIQGQLAIWLISIFGNRENIAEVGALGRIGVMFTLISSIMNTIVLPSFTRCQSRSFLLRRYIQIMVGMLFLGVTIILISILFPRQLLWILGSQYSHLYKELNLMVVSAVTTSITQTMASLNAAKAWVQYAWVEIPIRISLQIVLLLNLDVSTIKGVLLLGILSNFSPLIVSIMRTYFGFRAYKYSTT